MMARMLTDLILIFEVVLEGLSLKHCISWIYLSLLEFGVDLNGSTIGDRLDSFKQQVGQVSSRDKLLWASSSSFFLFLQQKHLMLTFSSHHTPFSREIHESFLKDFSIWKCQTSIFWTLQMSLLQSEWECHAKHFNSSKVSHTWWKLSWYKKD